MRALGFRIGLHTGGAHPQRAAAVPPLVDWVGLDAKAPFVDYERITAVAASGTRALSSLEHVLASGVDHETRTTVHPALLSDENLADMARDLAARDVKHYVIQAFRSQGCRDEGLRWNTVRGRPLQEVGTEFAGLFEDFSVRA